MSDTETPADDSQRATFTQSTQLLLGVSLGCQVALVLYGIYLVLHGRYVCSSMYKKALRPVKVTLWAVFVLLTGYMGLCIAEITTWTITTDRRLERLYGGYEFESYPGFIGGFIGNAVQVFLMLRAASLFRNRTMRWLFLGVTSFLILFSFTGAILNFANNMLFYDNKPYIVVNFNIITTTWFFSLAAIDLLISVSLAATLKQRIGGFNANTDALLRRLAITALQTASYTCLLTFVGAVLSAVYRTSSTQYAIGYAFFYPIPCCYGLSLYTTLSARQTVERYIGSNAPLPGSAHAGISGNDVTGGAGALGEYRRATQSGSMPLPMSHAGTGGGMGRGGRSVLQVPVQTRTGGRKGESDSGEERFALKRSASVESV
ncbi:hypothetical protein JCM10207_005225 [Rhodosporidiobolus poonsookiae]